MITVYKILQCPLCKTGVSESLECPNCGEKYIFDKDVYIMVNKKLSKREWKWDEKQFTDEKQAAFRARYRSYFNEETKKAYGIWFAEMNKRIETFHGMVCDVATGLGGMFDTLMSSKTDFFPIATDVDPNVLAWTTKKMKEKYDKEFISVATDGKHFAFPDDTFDCVTSLAALGNIPDTTIVLRELHRILKKDGKFVMMNTFVKKWSRSHWLAKLLKLERGCIEQYLLEDMKKTGFKDVQSNIISSARWARNPMDGLPVAGDMNYYAIIEARK